MPEKNPKKVTFTENDAATLTQRYDATTVLTLLQEVANYPEAKIDWNELVKKTSTGISSAREYQMLWRHLAYRDPLADNLEDGAEPLDDDSDLECELEAVPQVGVESAAEAAACVKVMIASRSLSESTPSSSLIEAPLTINVPVCHSSGTSNGSSQPSDLMHGTNIIFPVTVQRQTLPTVSSSDGLDTKGLGSGNTASKRKRAQWSEEEDKQLRAAVQRWGEGNWATILKDDNFPVKRSPTQLAQRWGVLRKKDGSTNSGTVVSSTPYTTAEQLATRHSLSLALDMPFKKLSAPGTTNQGRTTSLNPPSKNQVQRNTRDPNSIPPQHPSQQPLSSAPSSKPRLIPEKPVPRVNSTPSPDVKAIALAAGARIISPSGAPQLKVAQVRNVVTSTSTTLAKPSTLAGLPSESKVQSSTGPNVAVVPAQTAAVGASPAPCASVGKASTAPSILSEQNKNITSPVVNEVPVKQEINTCPAPKESVQNNENLDQDNSKNIPVKEGTAPSTESTRIVEAVKTNNQQIASLSTESTRIVEAVKTNNQQIASLSTESTRTVDAVETNNQQIASGCNGDKGTDDSNQEKGKDSINGSSEIKP